MMNTITVDDEKEIFKCLMGCGCCARCCLRFLGIRTLKHYDTPAEYAKQSGYIDTEESLKNDIPCTVCLGILQDSTQDSVIEKVKCEVQKQDYDCTSFTCALTIPVSVRLREQSFHVHVARNLNLSESTTNALKTKLHNIKDVWKSLILPKIEQAIGKSASSLSPFLIEVYLEHHTDENKCADIVNKLNKINSKGSHKKRKFNEKFSRKGIENLMCEISDNEFAEYFQVPPAVVDTFIGVEKVLCSHGSIFIGGRYNKFSRHLSQTPWFINGEKKMETSVQDILCNPIAETVKAQSIKFLSSGREDVDVRNIYSGRPFAVELVDPRMTIIPETLLEELVDRINSSTTLVKITSKLKVLTKIDLKLLKEGENVKTKFYRVLCLCRNVSREEISLDRLNETKHLKIIQKTPVRVLHRRPLTPRERYVYEMRARWVTPDEMKMLDVAKENTTLFVLDVKTQAGTYVKEFVHGDFARTKPSLCDLLQADVDVVALDVTGINLNWP